MFQGAKAGTYDPNYQTLAGIGGDVYSEQTRKEVVVEVAEVEEACSTCKPASKSRHLRSELQTLAELVAMYLERTRRRLEVVVEGEEESLKLLRIRFGAKAATFDPNYQTLAGLGGDVFGADKKGGGGGKPAAPKAPANLGAKAGTFDPNYQTLAGIGGNEVFGADKKR
ncbi:hypothetical protein OSTOST_07845 [Ostertagia ostertagi]